MAALLHTLLHLMLLIWAASAWSRNRRPQNNERHYRYYGGSITFTPKGRNPDGTYQVELRNKQATYYCDVNGFRCYYGNCGITQQSSSAVVAQNSLGSTWCQKETVITQKLGGNMPFAIRYPTNYQSSRGRGYWFSNVRSTRAGWRMMAHMDLGIRSDTGESNRSPSTAIIPILRVTRNCPRSFSIPMFDADGDRVRCRVPTSSNNYECALCGLTSGFSLNQNNCTIKYAGGLQPNQYQPIELIVEDFPHKHITLSYSDGYYTSKLPLTSGRRKRQLPGIGGSPTITTTAAPTTITSAPTNTTPVPTTTTPLPTTTTPLPTSTTTALPTTTGRPFRSSIVQLSKVPIQFSVFVDSHQAPSCLYGDFFPIFLSPTPSNGVNLPAYVNQTLEIRVRSTALWSSIVGLIVTGPKGISRRQISTGEYVIKWTPTDKELNDHFPICFLSEARDSRGYVYQSELRCVTADVGNHETRVTCNETTITVEVEKSYLIRRNEENLHLNSFTGPSCNLTTLSNSSHLVATMSLSDCGTLIEEDDNNIIFKNDITSADVSQIISRQHDVDIAFSCVYPKRTNLTLGFRHKNPYAFTERGFGTFKFQFEFFESQRFRIQKDASTYPLEVSLKQRMFMQIEATTSIPDTELFVESCRATPYDNPNSRVAYTIIQNGCMKDNTVQIYPSSRNQFRFGMEAFEFIGAHEEVYISCTVLLCERGVSGTRCSQGCIASGTNRAKREAAAAAAAAQTSSHSISQGPLHLLRPPNKPLSPAGIGLVFNGMFIVGCVLVVAVVIYRSRGSRAKYQRLPTSETD